MRVPLVVVTGFLGSGKTTLINRLLARRAERAATGKIGVIVNELGEVGVDGALLGGEATRQVELPGGCVCCVLGDELDRTLIELVAANPGPEGRAAGGAAATRPGLDAIVLETTGVAEPLPIAWAVARAPVSEQIRLAAVVTLVDATSFRGARPVSGAVDAQVAYADVLLVTKAAIAGEAELRAVEAEARGLAPRALLRVADTDAHAAWLEDTLADPSLEHRPASPAGEVRPGHAHRHGPDEDCDECREVDNDGHRRAHGIDSVWLPVPDVIDLEELEDQLADLPANYLRIKGIMRAVDGRAGGPPEPRWVAVHRVGLRVSSEPIAVADAEEGRLVALGPHVNTDDLAACLARAIG